MKLYLTLKKKWFDMILSGEKTEEYREIKPYWEKRLMEEVFGGIRSFKNFKSIVFTNGYGGHRPSFEIEIDCMGIGKGFKDWGAEQGVEYFVLKLGKVLEKVEVKG